MNLFTVICMLPGLVVGLTAHEFAHAWSAHLLGDDYPRRLGRVSLNPFRHLSLLGTLAIFLLPIGWGKAVTVNLYNFRHPRRDYLLTSLAGPAANLLIVVLCGWFMWLTRDPYGPGMELNVTTYTLYEVAFLAAIINLLLATLNLLPIPPLDGSKIWPCLIPRMRLMGKKNAHWIWLVVIIVLIRTQTLTPVFRWPARIAYELLPARATSVEADYELALAAYEAEAYDEALVHVRRVLDLYPLTWKAYALEAHILHKTGDLAGALASIEIALEHHPDAYDYLLLRDQLLAEIQAAQSAEQKPQE